MDASSCRECRNRAHQTHRGDQQRTRHRDDREVAVRRKAEESNSALLVEIETVIATVTSLQASGSQAAPQAAPSATAQPSRDPRAAAAAQTRMSDTAPHGKAPMAPFLDTEMPRGYCVHPTCWSVHKKLELDKKLEGFVAWCDRALGSCAAVRMSVGCCCGREKRKPVIGATDELRGATDSGVHGEHQPYQFRNLRATQNDHV